MHECLHTHTDTGFTHTSSQNKCRPGQYITCNKALGLYARSGSRTLQAVFSEHMPFGPASSGLRKQTGTEYAIILQASFCVWEQGRQSYALWKFAAIYRFRKTRKVLCKGHICSAEAAFSRTYTPGAWPTSTPNKQTCARQARQAHTPHSYIALATCAL